MYLNKVTNIPTAKLADKDSQWLLVAGFARELTNDLLFVYDLAGIILLYYTSYFDSFIHYGFSSVNNYFSNVFYGGIGTRTTHSTILFNQFDRQHLEQNVHVQQSIRVRFIMLLPSYNPSDIIWFRARLVFGILIETTSSNGKVISIKDIGDDIFNRMSLANLCNNKGASILAVRYTNLDKEILLNKECFEIEDGAPINPRCDRLVTGIQITYLGQDSCNTCGSEDAAKDCKHCNGKTFSEYGVSLFENDQLLIKHTNAPFDIIRGQYIKKVIPFMAIRSGLGMEVYAEAHAPLVEPDGFEIDMRNYVKDRLERPPLRRKHVNGESVIMKWIEYDGITMNF